MRRIKKNVKINYISDKYFKINDYDVEKVLVKHGNLKPAFGYIISKNDAKIGFTGDTCYCKQVEYMASICNYLVCDCSFKVGNDKHMGIDNILNMAKKYKNHKFIVSHMSDVTRNKINELKLENIIIPNDGDIIEII